MSRNITGEHMKNVVEIENIPTMKEMYDNVKQDNGKGAPSDANNREYGGTVNKDNTVTTAPPGPGKDPSRDAFADINIDVSSDTP